VPDKVLSSTTDGRFGSLDPKLSAVVSREKRCDFHGKTLEGARKIFALELRIITTRTWKRRELKLKDRGPKLSGASRFCGITWLVGSYFTVFCSWLRSSPTALHRYTFVTSSFQTENSGPTQLRTTASLGFSSMCFVAVKNSYRYSFLS